MIIDDVTKKSKFRGFLVVTVVPWSDIVVTCLQQGQASIATSLCIFFTTHTLFLSSFCMSSYFAQ